MTGTIIVYLLVAAFSAYQGYRLSREEAWQLHAAVHVVIGVVFGLLWPLLLPPAVVIWARERRQP